jgi:hypothetical protein
MDNVDVVLAGGCEVQVFKLYMGSIQIACISKRLLKINQTFVNIKGTTRVFHKFSVNKLSYIVYMLASLARDMWVPRAG